ncbi:MAG: hypothetical protein ACXVIY_03135 [Mucilaginibacter sp.]
MKAIRKCNPVLYKLSVHWQTFLWWFGIAWHNSYANECTPDFNCCENIGRDYFFRWNHKTELRNKVALIIMLACVVAMLTMLILITVWVAMNPKEYQATNYYP